MPECKEEGKCGVVTPEEYRRAMTKEVKLESGFVFRIKKLSMSAMSQFLDLVGIPATPAVSPKDIETTMKSQMDKPEFKTKVIEAMEVVIPAGVAEPRVVKQTNPDDRNALLLDDIAFPDQMELFMDIINFTGLTEAAKKFRKRIVR